MAKKLKRKEKTSIKLGRIGINYIHAILRTMTLTCLFRSCYRGVSVPGLQQTRDRILTGGGEIRRCFRHIPALRKEKHRREYCKMNNNSSNLFEGSEVRANGCAVAYCRCCKDALCDSRLSSETSKRFAHTFLNYDLFGPHSMPHYFLVVASDATLYKTQIESGVIAVW